MKEPALHGYKFVANTLNSGYKGFKELPLNIWCFMWNKFYSKIGNVGL